MTDSPSYIKIDQFDWDKSKNELVHHAVFKSLDLPHNIIVVGKTMNARYRRVTATFINSTNVLRYKIEKDTILDKNTCPLSLDQFPDVIFYYSP